MNTGDDIVLKYNRRDSMDSYIIGKYMCTLDGYYYLIRYSTPEKYSVYEYSISSKEEYKEFKKQKDIKETKDAIIRAQSHIDKWTKELEELTKT